MTLKNGLGVRQGYHCYHVIIR